MSVNLDSFDLDSTATDEVRDRIIHPLSSIAKLISNNFGQNDEQSSARESLRRLLWSRNQIWHCFVRTDADNLPVSDTTEIVQQLTEIDNSSEQSKQVTQAISEFIIKINDGLPERVDKFSAYQYMLGARSIFLQSLESTNA